METVKTGGPAFPQRHEEGDGNYMQYFGLSVRDYFAAKVAAGDAACESGWGASVSDETIAARAQIYYRVADAMLLAREKP